LTENFKKLGDDELAALCKKGLEKAFRELYERYRQRIMNYAFRMLRDVDAAADVLQETFQYFFRKLPEYRSEGKLSILLFRVARSLCLNRLRKIRTAKELPLEENAIIAQADADVQKPLEMAEARKHVAAALAQISPIYSEVIILRMLKGIPVAEVAEIVECPEGTVKSRLHNGLEMLRSMLKGRDFL